MNRHINRSIELVLATAFLVSVGFNVYQYYNTKILTAAVRENSILSNMPVEFTQKELKNIKKYSAKIKVPENLLKAVGQNEDGLGNHTFGVRRIRLSTKILYPIDLWQLVDCANIIKDEMRRFCVINEKEFPNENAMLEYININKRSFLYQLAHRYCPKNETIWFDNVYSLWKNFEKEASK